MYNQNMFEKDL